MESGRNIQDEREARRCLRDLERSGLKTGEWALARGIDGRSLHAWRMNLARWGSTSASPRRGPKSAKTSRKLIELGPENRGSAMAARYVLELGGARVEFGDDVSVATLRRVLEALRTC